MEKSNEIGKNSSKTFPCSKEIRLCWNIECFVVFKRTKENLRKFYCCDQCKTRENNHNRTAAKF
jgi:hypothetical protein